MKARDLSLGDWVLCDRKPYQIAEIGGMVCLDYDKELFAELDDIVPISITEDILKKNNLCANYKVVENQKTGVKFSTQIVVTKFSGHYRLFIGKYVNGEPIGCDGLKMDIPIWYVHELQHALKLCGIDKEIVL